MSSILYALIPFWRDLNFNSICVFVSSRKVYVSVPIFVYRYYNDYKESLSMVKISKILTWIEFRSEKNVYRSIYIILALFDPSFSIRNSRVKGEDWGTFKFDFPIPYNSARNFVSSLANVNCNNYRDAAFPLNVPPSNTGDIAKYHN